MSNSLTVSPISVPKFVHVILDLKVSHQKSRCNIYTQVLSWLNYHMDTSKDFSHAPTI